MQRLFKINGPIQLSGNFYNQTLQPPTNHVNERIVRAHMPKTNLSVCRSISETAPLQVAHTHSIIVGVIYVDSPLARRKGKTYVLSARKFVSGTCQNGTD